VKIVKRTGLKDFGLGNVKHYGLEKFLFTNNMVYAPGGILFARRRI